METGPSAVAQFVEEKLDEDGALPKDIVVEDEVLQAPNESYETYFGDLHEHSGLSWDARGDPFEAYRYARDVAQLDFFSLTDHAEFLILWPWDNKWERIRAAADSADRPGEFAALWGFEWSNPVLGHLSIFNAEDFTDSVTMFWLGSVYNWIHDRPAAFARFNHPGDYDLIHHELLYFKLYPQAVAQLTGVELFNQDAGFDRYYYPDSWVSDLSYYDFGNLRGWRLGATGGQDNHRMEWGLRNEFRTGVLAKELTRAGITEAHLARRFYSTEDQNLYLDFRSSGYPMGSRLNGLPREFTVTARDAGTDTFSKVCLLRNGQVFAEQAVSGNPITLEFKDLINRGPDYYYVIVTQNDDNDGNGRNDEAISSPIWFDSQEAPAPFPACGKTQNNANTHHAGDIAITLAAGLIIAVLLRRRVLRPQERRIPPR